MMRYALFFLWLAITFRLLFMAISDYAFNDHINPKAAAKLFGARCLLSIVWPLALLSARGRGIFQQLIQGI